MGGNDSPLIVSGDKGLNMNSNNGYEKIVEKLGTPEVLTLSQGAELRDVKLKTFYNYIQTGRLDVKTYQIGRKKYLLRKELLEAIKKENAHH